MATAPGCGWSPGVQLHHLLPGLGVPALHLLAEAEVEVGHHHHHAHQDDDPGVPEEVPEGQPQGGADDDVRRVPAHGGRPLGWR